MLQCVRSYAARRSAASTNEDPAKVALEEAVRSYLNNSSIKAVTRPQIEAVKATLEAFRMTKADSEDDAKLSKAEVYELLNSLPSTQVELFLLIRSIEDRMSEAEIQGLLDAIASALSRSS